MAFRDFALRVFASLEVVSELLEDRPIVVTSLYRCPALNEKLNGSDTSAHLRALAADFVVLGLTPYAVVDRLVDAGILKDDALDVDQLIYEGSWIHLGFAEGKGRRQLLTYKPLTVSELVGEAPHRSSYLPGLVKLGVE